MAHEGGTKVNYGFYWSAKAWDMAMVPAEGGLLPGGSDRHYTRIPTVLFLLMAPMMGALYVVFLPFAGFALVAGHALRRAEDAGAGHGHAHRRGGEPELGARRGVSGEPQARQGRARRRPHSGRATRTTSSLGDSGLKLGTPEEHGRGASPGAVRAARADGCRMGARHPEAPPPVRVSA